jgi:hypothetical protein
MTNALRLQELAAEEERLYSSLPAHSRSSDSDVESLIYRSYTTIVDGYLELARQGDSEALKRAVFLWWYSVAEPMHLTGIPEFTPRQNDATARLLRDAVGAGTDAEFERMLAWYYCITDWQFEQLVPDLIATFDRMSTAARGPDGVITLELVNVDQPRGQLTIYFRSMTTGPWSRTKLS